MQEIKKEALLFLNICNYFIGIPRLFLLSLLSVDHNFSSCMIIWYDSSSSSMTKYPSWTCCFACNCLEGVFSRLCSLSKMGVVILAIMSSICLRTIDHWRPFGQLIRVRIFKVFFLRFKTKYVLRDPFMCYHLQAGTNLGFQAREGRSIRKKNSNKHPYSINKLLAKINIQNHCFLIH